MSDTTLTDANAALHIAYVVDPSRNTFSAGVYTVGYFTNRSVKSLDACMRTFVFFNNVNLKFM